MKTLLASSLLLISLNSFAHEDHDWRQDYQAYLSVEYVLPGVQKSMIIPRTQAPRVDMNFFKEKLTQFTMNIAERKSQKNLDLARQVLRAEYEKLGFKVSMQPFGSGTNFIAEKQGNKTPQKVLILSSHIDSVGNHGTNDNGTGSVGLLAVAKVMAAKNYASTIRILGFDREEVGLVGSDAYVATISDRDNVIGNINFEMMGVNSRRDGAFHVIDCSKANSLFLTQSILDSIQSLSLPLHVVKTCTDRSDHASFWRKKIPAVVISENFFGGDADPCYHARCDVMDERLNYEYMGNILESVLDASEKLIK